MSCALKKAAEKPFFTSYTPFFFMRCFLALDLPETAQSSLSALQVDLKQLGLYATFPTFENLHATLCFFGEISKRQAEEKAAFLSEFSSLAFDAVLQGVGFFPSDRHVNVVWAGFGSGREKIVLMQQQVARFLDYRDEKLFFPHVTLARVKSKPDFEALSAWKQKWSCVLAHFRAERLTLFESVLDSTGPHYRALASVALR